MSTERENVMGQRLPLVSLAKLVRNPRRFLNKRVRVRGRLHYIGQTPGGSVYTVNLPELSYDVALICAEGQKLVCYALHDLNLKELSEAEVEVVGYLIEVNGRLVFRIIAVRIVGVRR